jgi:hypothetical protein
LVVDSYVAAIWVYPKQRVRHAVIPCNIPTEHALDAMTALQCEYGAVGELQEMCCELTLFAGKIVLQRDTALKIS